jgi:hypothetical protein
LRGAWLSGQQVDKLIGFDVTETHRTYASSGGGMEVAPDPALPPFSQRYRVRYPLREWGLDRAACMQVILDAGLPLPPKSACFFCPSMKEHEIQALRADDPEAWALALEMERRYRAGKHFRGDGCYTVKAEHKTTGEKVEVELHGASAATVVAAFRQTYKDARPYQWQVRASLAVPGLGRSFAWQHLPMV